MNLAYQTYPAARHFEFASPPAQVEQFHDFRSWKDFVNDNFPWLEHRDHSGGRFGAQVSTYKVGRCSLSTIHVEASEVIRRRGLSAVAETGYIKLMWQIAGDAQLEQDRRQCRLEAGQATVFDTARPYRIRLSDGARFVVFMLPHDACPGWEHISQAICGARLAEGPGVRAALGALMAIVEEGHDPGHGDNQAVVQAVQWMLSTALHRAASDRGMTVSRDPKLCRAQQYVVGHLSDPELDAEDIAAALCMSRRSLYLLFKEYGLTPGRMIHDLRLEQSGRILGDPDHNHRKITDIAFDLGFGDYATFSRMFKARFGITPSAYRTRCHTVHA